MSMTSEYVSPSLIFFILLLLIDVFNWLEQEKKERFLYLVFFLYLNVIFALD